MSKLVHEVALELKLHVDTIKRCERRGLISPKRDCNGWRRFDDKTVETLKRLYVQNDDAEGARHG
jgi:DNA-binding transcriptional MerR regulator